MTYIQLSLYGIPAVVYCGNTITRETRFKMETPLYYLQYWKFQGCNMQDNLEDNKNIKQTESRIIVEKPIDKEKIFNEITIKGNTQLSLW